MILDALLAYLHYVAIFVFFAFLTAAIMLLRGTVDAKMVLLLKRCDVWIGAAAIATIITGVLRLFAGAKAASFHMGNPVFWLKIGVFVVVGLLAIKPGMAISRWARMAHQDGAFRPNETELLAVRKRLLLQIHLLALLPLAAVFMARGL